MNCESSNNIGSCSKIRELEIDLQRGTNLSLKIIKFDWWENFVKIKLIQSDWTDKFFPRQGRANKLRKNLLLSLTYKTDRQGWQRVWQVNVGRLDFWVWPWVVYKNYRSLQERKNKGEKSVKRKENVIGFFSLSNFEELFNEEIFLFRQFNIFNFHVERNYQLKNLKRRKLQNDCFLKLVDSIPTNQTKARKTLSKSFVFLIFSDQNSFKCCDLLCSHFTVSIEKSHLLSGWKFKKHSWKRSLCRLSSFSCKEEKRNEKLIRENFQWIYLWREWEIAHRCGKSFRKLHWTYLKAFKVSVWFISALICQTPHGRLFYSSECCEIIFPQWYEILSDKSHFCLTWTTFQRERSREPKRLENVNWVYLREEEFLF